MSNKAQSDLQKELDVILAAADAAAEAAQTSPVEDRLTTLETRLSSIEPLLEQLQANAKIGPQLTNYVQDLRAEQVFFNKARWAVGVFSALAILISV